MYTVTKQYKFAALHKYGRPLTNHVSLCRVPAQRNPQCCSELHRVGLVRPHQGIHSPAGAAIRQHPLPLPLRCWCRILHHTVCVPHRRGEDPVNEIHCWPVLRRTPMCSQDVPGGWTQGLLQGVGFHHSHFSGKCLEVLRKTWQCTADKTGSSLVNV